MDPYITHPKAPTILYNHFSYSPNLLSTNQKSKSKPKETPNLNPFRDSQTNFEKNAAISFEAGLQFHTMPFAENDKAAREAAITAHGWHFGTRNKYRLEQDGKLISSNLPASKDKEMEEVTYTVQFDLEPTQAKATRETSLKFTVWLHKAFPGDFKPPVQCTAHNCPLNKAHKPTLEKFHYRGLYMEIGEPLYGTDEFGDTQPSYKVNEAKKRLKWGNPERGDEEMMNAFVECHYWLEKSGERILESDEDY